MDKLNFARHLRKVQTETEKLLWYHLRNRQLGGVKFRRQQLIGSYIVDFVSFEKMLVIELDGSQHNLEGQSKKDQKRTVYLESLGYKVLRFWDNEVLRNIDEVLGIILRQIPPTLTLPLNGEGKMRRL